MNKCREERLIVKSYLIIRTHIPSSVTAAAVLLYFFCVSRYSYSTYTNTNKKMTKQKVSKEKTEQNYGDGTRCKSGIHGTNADNLCSYCCGCSIFAAVDTTTEIV